MKEWGKLLLKDLVIGFTALAFVLYGQQETLSVDIKQQNLKAYQQQVPEPELLVGFVPIAGGHFSMDSTAIRNLVENLRKTQNTR